MRGIIKCQQKNVFEWTVFVVEYCPLLSQMRCPPLSMPYALLIAEQSQHARIIQCDDPPPGLHAPAGRTTTQGGFCGEDAATTITGWNANAMYVHSHAN